MGALVFDYDGLMVDSERVLAQHIIDALGRRGASLSVADIGHLFGSTEADSEWEHLLATNCDPPMRLAELLDLLRPTVRPAVDALPLLPGVLDLLEAAESLGWKVGLATGQGMDRLQANLDRLDLLHRFDAVVTAAEVEQGKPAPDIFLEVSRRVGVRPSQCVALEDSLPGCRAAVAAGMAVIACPSLVSVHLEFPPEARRVASLAEVKVRDLLASVS